MAIVREQGGTELQDVEIVPVLPTSGDGEVRLLDVVITLSAKKKEIARVTLAVAIITAIVVLLMPNTYVGTTILMPPQKAPSVAAFMGERAGLTGLLSAPDISFRDPNDIYIALLQSRSASDTMIHRFDLMKVYGTKTMAATRERLSDNARFISAKGGTVTVEVEDSSPKRAADMANAYVEELQRIAQQVGVSDASRRRRFFENQLKRIREDLSNAEADLKKTQEKTGLIALTDQARAIIENVARVRALVATKQVELQVTRTYATEQNPELRLKLQVLAALNSELAKMERSAQIGGGNIQVPTGQIPTAALEYARKLREVKFYEAANQLLQQQYEAAVIDEANVGTVIEVVDQATPPERKSITVNSNHVDNTLGGNRNGILVLGRDAGDTRAGFINASG